MTKAWEVGESVGEDGIKTAFKCCLKLKFKQKHEEAYAQTNEGDSRHCLGAGRVDITGRVWAKCSALYGTSLAALTKNHNDKLDKIKEDANESLEEAGIAKIQRDALIKENARKRRIENIAAHNDAVSQIWEDWRDCLLEFANSGSEDEASENQD